MHLLAQKHVYTRKRASRRVCHYVSHALSLCIRSPCVLTASWHTAHKRSAYQLHCTCGYYTNWWCKRTIALNDVNADTIQKGFCLHSSDIAASSTNLHFTTGNFTSMWQRHEISAFTMLLSLLNALLKTEVEKCPPLVEYTYSFPERVSWSHWVANLSQTQISRCKDQHINSAQCT
jgi:hypothetical protein